MATIKAIKLKKIYNPKNVVALDDVSFTVESGEAVAIIGPSGAGKTTLFRVLTRSITLDGGRVEIDGVDLFSTNYLKLSEVRRGLGTIYQQHNLVRELSVVNNVIMGKLGTWSSLQALKALLFGSPAETMTEVVEALAKVGLEDKVDSAICCLSGGEQQRIAIARLLVQDPNIILADEPVASVDPASADKIMEIFRELNLQRGKTIVCNLHNLFLAKDFFGRVIALQQGKMLFDGSPAQLTPSLLEQIYTKEREWLSPSDNTRSACIKRMAREGDILAKKRSL